jgi:uncharacterized protein involved in exopolysaccharide biosynthesis
MLLKNYPLNHSPVDQPRADESIILRTILVVLLRDFRRFIAINGFVVLLGLLFVSLLHPTFISNGSLYTGGIRESAAVAAGAPDANNNEPSYMSDFPAFNSVGDIQTQVNVLTSPALVQKAVLATGLNARISGPGINSPRYFVWKTLDLSSVSIFSPDKTSLQALYVSFVDPSVVTETFTVLIQKAGHYTITQDGAPVLDGVLNQPASGGGLILLLQVPNGNQTPAEGNQYELTVSAPAVTAEEILNGPLTVLPAGTMALPSEVMNISFRWRNPYQAKAFVDKLMSIYIDTVVSWNSSAASSVESFIDSQLKDDSSKLAATNQSLATYQEQTGIISPADNAKDAVDQESQFEAQRAQLQIQIVALQQLWNNLDNHDDELDPYMLSQAADTPLSELSEKLAVDVAAMKALQAHLSANMPQLVGEVALIAQEKVDIRSMIKNELHEATTQLNAINTQISKYQTKIGAVPSESLQIKGMTRSSEVFGQLYVELIQKQEEATLSKAAALSATQVLMPAQLPLKASERRVLIIIVVAFVAGLFGSCLWVLAPRVLSEHLNAENKIRSLGNSRAFVLSTEAPVSATTAIKEIEVALPNGCRIRVDSEVDHVALAGIITAVSNVPP